MGRGEGSSGGRGPLRAGRLSATHGPHGPAARAVVDRENRPYRGGDVFGVPPPIRKRAPREARGRMGREMQASGRVRPSRLHCCAARNLTASTPLQQAQPADGPASADACSSRHSPPESGSRAAVTHKRGARDCDRASCLNPEMIAPSSSALPAKLRRPGDIAIHRERGEDGVAARELQWCGRSKSRRMLGMNVSFVLQHDPAQPEPVPCPAAVVIEV